MRLVNALLVLVRATLLSRAGLAVENLALRQQLAVLKRSVNGGGHGAGLRNVNLPVDSGRVGKFPDRGCHRTANGYRNRRLP